MSDENHKAVFPYRERYLETILARGDPNENFETMLAKLYIEKLFEIQDPIITEEVMLRPQDEPLRIKLN